MVYGRLRRVTPAGAASAASTRVTTVAVTLVVAAAALSAGAPPAAAAAPPPPPAASAAAFAATSLAPRTGRPALDAAAAAGTLPAPVDRQRLVKLFAALSAAATWLTRPDVYGVTDGAGGAGGTFPRAGPLDAGRPAAVVTLHGLGGSGAHAVDRLREDLTAPTLRYTSLYGPSTGTDGAGTYRSWFPIGSVRLNQVPAADGPAGAAADLAAAAARIDRVIAATGVPRGRVVLVGFSQGAATAIDYVLAGRAKGLAGIMLSAGWVPRPKRAATATAAAAAAGLRVAIAHGRWDWLVPVRAAERVAAALRAAGATVGVTRYSDDHFFSDHPPAEEALAAFVRSVVPP
ncbi:hypothetical protein I4F81_006379 [Pyropia yezoensis]|uniref:Uncharacterized protein n=1 Tax=Pyropia yezoensis TaxID=2788 RepID=A0ACC3C1E7_PYRYE|nr:hypothetical protein I4F81_006379 [Neopyropia yezoensis]